MSEDYAPVFPCLPETNGYWRVPDVYSLAEVMRESYELRIESANRGLLGSEYARTVLTWDRCVTQIKSIIEELVDENNISDNASLQRGISNQALY